MKKIVTTLRDDERTRGAVVAGKSGTSHPSTGPCLPSTYRGRGGRGALGSAPPPSPPASPVALAVIVQIQRLSQHGEGSAANRIYGLRRLWQDWYRKANTVLPTPPACN